MTNVEQYINNDRHCFPPTNTDSLNIPKRCSRHLLVDKYLSEYKTEQEKKLVMQNILLMDSVPKENSNRLVNSGTVYKVMREGKLGRDQLTELFNYLQRTKADKSELFSKDYRELTNTPNFIQQQDLENYYDKNEIDNIIQNISLDNIDLSGYATQEYVQNQINNLIDGAPEALNTLKEITDKLSADGDIVNQILNQINEKADKSDIEISVIDTNGHEYVDLGLPSGTLWATMNIGATSETDYGNYYQYGKGAAQYAATNSDSNYSGTEDPLNSSVDTAVQVWGGSWHMPTRAQIQELTANTTYQWVTNYKGSGIDGGTFTATNGAVLFLPAAGNWGNVSLYNVGNFGYYWGSSPYTSTGKPNPAYKSLVELADLKTAQNVGVDAADQVRITSATLSENNFVSRNGNLINGFQIRGSFINAAKLTDAATFNTEIYIMDIHDETDREGDPTGRLVVRGGIVQYGGRLDVLDFIVEAPEKVEFVSRNWEVNTTQRIVGRVRVTSHEVEASGESSGWGEDIPDTTTTFVRELIITGGDDTAKDEEFSYDPVDIKKAFNVRKAMIEQMQIDARSKAPKQGSSGHTDAKKYEWE